MVVRYLFIEMGRGWDFFELGTFLNWVGPPPPTPPPIKLTCPPKYSSKQVE